MVRHCISPDCCGDKNRTLFRVPKDIIRRQMWFRAVRDAYPNLDVGEKFCVCKKHFRKADYTPYIFDKSGNIVQEVQGYWLYFHRPSSSFILNFGKKN